MFHIAPIQDKNTQAQIAAACGAPFRPECFAYQMTDSDSGELMGMAQFELFDGYGKLYDLREAPAKNDFEAMFILGRTAMNFIDLCGGRICRAEAATAPERLLLSLGFIRDKNGEYAADLNGMFNGHCSGKPVDLAK